MKTTVNIIFGFLLTLICQVALAQKEPYQYHRELKGIESQWHKIILPNSIFDQLNSNFSDIRILGITAENDTVEAPYLMQLAKDKTSTENVDFNLLNVSSRGTVNYFTLEIPSAAPINQIQLDFEQTNFDWRLKLEGSKNQEDWFTIADNYRILSIQNERIDFDFTQINFGKSNYRYYRVAIESDVKPVITRAHVQQRENTAGSYRNYEVVSTEKVPDNSSKQTEIHFELKEPVPVSTIAVHVADTFDYYRPARIQYLADSLQTEQGWQYQYTTLATGTLNSFENNVLKINSVVAQKFKLIVENADNEPLKIDSIEANGLEHQLMVRITKPATYYLFYGNNSAHKPRYDIAQFRDNIPESAALLTLGDEVKMELKEDAKTQPLFQNSAWLWAIMAVIIILLGTFSYKMISQPK